MLTTTQIKTALAIINIFETGRVQGDYGAVTIIPGDSGKLTFGRSQTTLTSGGLGELIAAYCSNSGALFAGLLSPFVDDLNNQAETVNTDLYLHNVLRASADDPVMRDIQDSFFDQHYWQPSVRSAKNLGIDLPLGFAIVYDSKVHGSWLTIRRRTIDAVGRPGNQPGDIDEREWLSEYVKQRHQWLANHSRADLRATVYRMNVFQQLIEAGDWAMELPLVVRRREINLDSLSALPRGIYNGPAVGSRIISVASPLLRGQDVRLLQMALSRLEHPLTADGIFGRRSRDAVKAFQQTSGLTVTGSVGIAEFSALGLV